MADTEVRVWVKTSTLDRIVFGKTHATSKRQSITTSSVADSDPKLVNWGWARGKIVPSDDGSSAEDAFATTGADEGGGGDVQVFIEDEESEHNRTAVQVPRADFREHNVVMTNMYGDENGGQDGFDDDGYGGSSGCPYPSDLITLTHLHEPAVVYCLRQRYEYDEIYTSTGPILIALNPFKNCKSLYSEAVMKRYYNRGERLMLNSGSTAAKAADSVEEEKKSESPSEQVNDEEELDPHVYGIADHSFRSMMTSLEEKNIGIGGGGRRKPGESSEKSSNQSILVSGESGAGKTVTTKFIMQYLATLSKRSHKQELIKTSSGRNVVTAASSDSRVNIEQQVLQSNPILESFGNARTVRNDNSSRFGKFIEIQFTSAGCLVGASIQTYLLEKVRLITQADGERNYHIFYELLAGMDDDDLDRYHLGDYTAEDFCITSNSDTYDRRDGVDDAETYQDLMDAMDTMGFTDAEKHDILGITVAQLHSSNLTLNSLSADESEIDRTNVHLDPVLKLMGFTADALNRALCYFSIQAGKEKHVRSLPKTKAAKGLEALIKATYGALFDYIVQRINSSITVKSDGTKRRGAGGGGSRGAGGGGGATIGVLDIFGFESFKKNSFEQLCINYCNEALQQQFNLFVLKNEQEEYEREGIKWSFISFPENQDVLDLIGKKGSGILPILDDQCRAPGTTDKTFANDIYKKCTDNPRFEANFRQVGALCFGIHHYAGPVEYDTDGFVEKNRDDLPKEASELLLSSTNEFVRKLADILTGEGAATAGAGKAPSSARKSAGKRVTVGGQFSQQLSDLRSKIDLTSPHYVRCLKPNDMLVPDHFDPVIVADQLRCAGVVEAVRVSRVGYPQRYSHALFVNRYRILAIRELKKAARSSRRQRPVEVLVNAIAARIADTEGGKDGTKEEETGEPVDLLVSVGIQVGKTKVFLRRKAYDTIERLRSNEMRRAAVKVQAVGRRYVAMREYDEALRATVRLQCFVRRVLASKRVDVMRRNYNATVIQTAYRRMVARNSFLGVVAVVSWGQRMQRGHAGRARYGTLNRERKATVVQKYWRGHCSSKVYGRKRNAALTIQCALRCHWARQALKDLRAQARDLSATANERDELRQETQKLRQEVENAKAVAKLEAERAATAAAALEGASSKGAVEADELRQETERLRSELQEMRDQIKEYSGRASEALASANASSEELESVQRENEELKKQLDGLTITSEEKTKEFATVADEMERLKAELHETRDIRQENEELKQQLESFATESGNDLREETEKLETELKEVRESAAEEVEALKSDLEEARELAAEEIQALKSELKEAHESAVLAAATFAADTPQSVPADPSEEVEKFQEKVNDLMKDLEGANEASKSSFKELETLRTENSRLQDALQAARSVKADNSNGTTTLSNQLAQAEKEIQDLKQRLTEAEKNAAEKGERAIAVSASAPRQMPQIPEDSEPDEKAMEILTLQDEVERLNNELAEVKEAGADNSDPDSPESLIRRYEELSRLSQALIEKDREVEDMKREVKDMKAELADGADLSAKDYSTSQTEESDGGTASTWQNPGNSSLENPGQGDRSTKDMNMALNAYKDEVMALREINEILRKDVEHSRKAAEEAKFELREETRRSAKELEAFAETLRGVDELRAAAEAMSREITKNRKYYMSDGGGALDAASSVAGATRRLSSMEQEEPGNFWTKMTGGIMGDSSRNLQQSPPSNEDRQKSSRRRRRRRQDEESVISAFF